MHVDLKEKEIFDRLIKKIINREFDEINVYTLLILLRRHGKRGEPLVEFADFVAHREKNRGDIHKYILTTKKKLDQIGKINTVIEIKEVYTYDEISNSINKTLNNLGYSPFNHDVISEVILCMFILLQDVRFVNKKNKEFGYLEIMLSDKEITLLGNAEINNRGRNINTIFPVCTLKNTFLNGLDDEGNTLKCLLGIKRDERKKMILFPDTNIRK